jgi:hypothetical protein
MAVRLAPDIPTLPRSQDGCTQGPCPPPKQPSLASVLLLLLATLGRPPLPFLL